MRTHKRGICYQGYRKNQSRLMGIFPSRKQVLEDLLILEKNFDVIRVYDSSKHTEDILSVIKEHHIRLDVMLSMYMYAEESHGHQPVAGSEKAERIAKNKIKNNELAEQVIELANTYQGIVTSISVGNEARSIWNPNRVGDHRIAELVNIVKAGVDVPVTYCDEWKSWVEELTETAEAVDFLSIHIYPVWNEIGIDDAMNYTNKCYQNIKELYPKKRIMITEAGWPTQTDEKRIPLNEATIQNQDRYVSELFAWSDEVDTTVFVFEAFDELWKGYNDPCDPEKNWGLYWDSREKKEEMK